MRQYDFSPFFRSTVGFDRLFQLLDQAGGSDESTYPPYNIERTAENAYRVSMAVAGFGKDELKLEVKEQSLTIKGEKAPAEADTSRAFLHRGIAARSFERRFQLADHMEVRGADLKDGLLHIDLVRNVPERLKPRTIGIGTGAETKRIEAQVA